MTEHVEGAEAGESRQTLAFVYFLDVEVYRNHFMGQNEWISVIFVFCAFQSKSRMFILYHFEIRFKWKRNVNKTYYDNDYDY